MNYIKEINAFIDWLETNPLDAITQVLWLHLMAINNKCNWLEWFTVANLSLQAKIQADKKTLIKHRNILIQKGRIEYKTQGKKQAGKYRLTSFGESISGNIPPIREPILVPNREPIKEPIREPLYKLNKTKLNDPDKGKVLDALIALYKECSPLNIKEFGRSAIIKARDIFDVAIQKGANPAKLAEAIQNNPNIPPWEITKKISEKPKERYGGLPMAGGDW